MKKTIAIDFDAVIHQYSHGWQDGTAYDKPVPGAIKKINEFLEKGYSVFIHSTRSKSQIIDWVMRYSNPYIYEDTMHSSSTVSALLDSNVMNITEEYNNKDQFQYKIKRIRFWTKFWNKKQVIGVTNRKLPATAYVDDRAIKFTGDWDTTAVAVDYFRTYQESYRPIEDLDNFRHFIYRQLGATTFIYQQHVDDLINDVIREGVSQTTWYGIVNSMEILGFDTSVTNKEVY